MESRFGRDFGPVRVHTDPMAAGSTKAVDALAYTVGQDIVFGEGRYEPNTSEGRKLIAHELAHTIQQTGPDAPMQRGVLTIMRQTPGSFPAALPEDASKQSEIPEPSPRSLAAIEMINRIVEKLLDVIAGKGILLPFEARTKAGGIGLALAGSTNKFEWEESIAERNHRVRNLVDDLAQIEHRLLREPIPPEWLEPEAFGIDWSQPSHGGDAVIDDVTHFYMRFAERKGRGSDVAFEKNRHYLTREKQEEVATPWGIYIVVPDPVNAPKKHNSGEYATPGQPIFELYEDSLGVFYYNPKRLLWEEKQYLGRTIDDVVRGFAF